MLFNHRRKSTFLNTLVGRSILPSDELPETSWPCRVRHSPQTEHPFLDVNPALFLEALGTLQTKKFGTKAREHTFSASVGSLEDNASEDEDKPRAPPPDLENDPRAIYEKLVDLQPKTRENLLRFEKENFVLRTHVEGLETIHEVLQELNDIVRLCIRLEVPLDLNAEPHLWPLLTVEFLSLRNRRLEGVFEFVDLPGISENFNKFKFEHLISRLSKEFTNIVPVISLKELALPNWELLPGIINNGTGSPPPLVVCTHYDTGADRLDEKVEKVKRVFGSDARGPQIIPCSPKMGYSAQTLLSMSMHEKPAFNLLWDETSVQYPCAKEILGAGEPELNYRNFSREKWRQSIEKQLEKSKLLCAFDCITRDIVPNAQRRLLISDNEAIRKLLKDIGDELKHELRGTRRSREKFEAEYKKFSEKKEMLLRMLAADTGVDYALKESLLAYSAALQKEGDLYLKKSVDLAIKELSPKVGIRSENGHEVLVFLNRSSHDAFYDMVHEELSSRLSTTQESYIYLIRDLIQRACNGRMVALRNDIADIPQDGSIDTDELKEVVLESITSREGKCYCSPSSETFLLHDC
ncbi:hypothetical protein SCHPADRAFT_279938 [Schizopora paradoxa]|uniref:Dynamin N-terminal domain-containing protein n=1 Tax=Schizopora paradoxa TaxID=27342 RepID=A0A0H2RU08_9AGAM|nr:hypothetical protein SCHPADRAFT_279938 [Schizopora paradoxa]